MGGILGLSIMAKAHTRHPDHLRWQECPSGYSMSTYYITVTSTVTPTTWTAIPEPRITANSNSTMISTDAIDSSSTNYPSTSLLAPSSIGSLSLITSTMSSTGAAVPPFSTTGTDAITATWMPVWSSDNIPLTTMSTTSSATAAAASSSSLTQNPASSSSSSSSTTPLVGGVMNGQATFYQGGDTAGTCMFTTYSLPPGIYGTALSVDNWDGAAWCGACVSVVGPSGNSIKAMIVNQCPGTCGLNNLDLLPNGFAKLADPTLGRIDVKWSIVGCGITSPIYLQNKIGTSQWWFSMQVVNSNVPVQSLEVSTDGANTWQPTVRRDYNFFENPSGFGVDVVDIRITSVTGETIIINNVSTASESSTTGSSNFS